MSSTGEANHGHGVGEKTLLPRCPICRATWQGRARCRRCGAELHALERITALGLEMEQQAVQELLEGEPVRARETLHRAMSLRKTPFAQALAGFSAFHLK